MSATIYYVGGGTRVVKNLGWLLRHWQGVEYLGFNYAPDSKKMIDGELIAKMKDGSTYITPYSSLSVCWNALKRPVFMGVELCIRVNYDGPFRVFLIGNHEYQRINRLPYKEQLDAILVSGSCRTQLVPPISFIP